MIRSVVTSALLLSGILSSPLYAANNLDEVKHWLQRVTEASQQYSYEDVFVYQHDNDIDTVRIIHKVDHAQTQERLISLNGEAREVIRKNEKVTCILPENNSVVEDKSIPRTTLPILPRSLNRLGHSYEFMMGKDDRIAGRAVTQVIIKPKDKYRYGYRLWIDKELGLLLRTELIDVHGRAIEQLMFTDLIVRNNIPDEMLTPNLKGKKLTWHKQTDEVKPRLGNVNKWKAIDLPDGFTMAHYNIHSLPTSRMPIDHLVYTDGLAWVSVYVEKDDATKGDSLEGVSTMGSVNAFGKYLDGYHITVVGEVPASAVKKIGYSIRYIKQAEADQ